MSMPPPDPNDLEGSYEWVRTQFGSDKPAHWEVALRHADKALQAVDDWQYSIEMQKATLLHLLGRKDEFRAWVARLALWYPDDPIVLLEQSTVAFDDGDYAAALSFAERALADPGENEQRCDQSALPRIVVCLAALGRTDEALRKADKTLAAQPELAPYLQHERDLIAEGRLDELLPESALSLAH